VCPRDCPYPFEENTGARLDHADVGICDRGTPVCDEEMNIVACEGQAYPEWEVCDGLDNDCDGKVDEHMRPIRNSQWHYYSSYGENPCWSPYGMCSMNWIHCEGEDGWVCRDHPDLELPNEWSCDRKDNDCDGWTDENLFVGEFCYEVPEDQWWTASNDPCRPGVYECQYGMKVCLGQIVPVPEVCDFIDNDCNGVIDDTGKTLNEKYDIVFIIDTSGSMMFTIGAVAQALDMYSSQFWGNEAYRFAILDIADPDHPYINLLTDFADLAVIHSILVHMAHNDTAYEASLDGPFMVCDMGHNPLNLSWREDAIPMFFMFTDEIPQSYRDPEIEALDVIHMCSAENQVAGYIWSMGGFGSIATSTGGQHFWLSNNFVDIFTDLNSIIIEICVD
jgi:hypothetical protein